MTDTTGASPEGPSRTEELRTLAERWLRDDDIATYCTVLLKVRELATALGNEETLNAFATMVKVVYRGHGMTQPPWDEVSDYLKDLKRAVKRVFTARSRAPGTANITNIEQMVDSGSPRLAIIGLLLRNMRGRIWYDVFLNKIMTNWRCERDVSVVEAYPVQDREMLKIMMWAMTQDIETLATVSMTNVNEAVSYVAYADERDCLLDHLGSLPQWDGIERLDIVMVQAFGCEIDDEAGQTAGYLKAVIRNTLISLIARAKEPGCKADFMPIFMGKQGAFKSTAMAIIGGPFYREIHESPNTKDFYISLHGCWVAEVAELASIVSSKVENAKAKAMLSRRTDNIRPPYARESRDFHRRNVFVGTSNPGGVGALRDETGNRRYGPVMCGILDLPWLEENRDQLLAEALKEYERGARWWELPEDAHNRATERHQQRSVHEDTIREHLLSAELYDGTANGPALIRPDVHAADWAARWGNIVTPKRVIMQWLNVPEDRVSSLFMEVSAALVRLGWRLKPTSVRIDGVKRSVNPWVPVDQTSRSEARTMRLLTDGVAYVPPHSVGNLF